MIETYHFYKERCLYMSNPKIIWISSPTPDTWLQKVEGVSSSSANRELGGGGLDLVDSRTIRTTLPLGEFCGFSLQRDLAIFRVLGFQEMKKGREAVWFPSYFVPGYHHCSSRLAHSSSDFLSDQRQKCLLSYFFSVGNQDVTDISGVT